jgi:hypothetical protein
MMTGSRLITAFALALGVCTATPNAISGAYPDAADSRGVGTMISYEVTTNDTEYHPQEHALLRVQITNLGDAPVDLPDPSYGGPQPTFRLTQLSAEPPQTFSYPPQTRNARAAQQEMVHIAPGENWETLLPMPFDLEELDSGEYRLESSWEHLQDTAHSTPQTFRTGPTDILSANLGLGSPAQAEGQLAFISGDSSHRRVLAADFLETRSDKGEVAIRPFTMRAKVGGSAADVACPWLNFPFYAELTHYVVWREKSSFYAQPDDQTEPIRLNLGEEPDYMVRPALKTHFKGVETLFVSQKGTRLLQALANSAVIDRTKAAQRGWNIHLPAVPHGITVALALPEQHDMRHLAFTGQLKDGIEVFHTRWAENGEPEPFQSVEIANAHLVPNTSPSCRVDANGIAHVSVIYYMVKKHREYALAEAVFDPHEAPSRTPNIIPLGAVAGDPTSAAILDVVAEGGAERRRVVLSVHRTEGNEVFKWEGEGGLSHVKVQGQPTTPILLMPGKTLTYILYIEPARGLYFEAI